jgi:DNA-binding transcriptional MerR regulator
MEQYFTTKDVEQSFKISHQTCKNWCDFFAEFLSPTARPEPGRKRMFTTQDMECFALIAQNQKAGFRYEDAVRALRSGQRGNIPQPEGQLPAVPPQILFQLREELKNRDAVIVALTTERDKATGQVEILERQLKDKDQRIEDLLLRLGELRVQIR